MVLCPHLLLRPSSPPSPPSPSFFTQSHTRVRAHTHPSLHQNSSGTVTKDISCAYASWRQRGWCRLEFVATELARNAIKCMLVKGGGATPEFVFSADATFLSPGLGRFTCCSLKHIKRNGDFMKCDKLKIGQVLDVMLTAKIDHLFQQRKWFDARYYICIGHWLRRGLDAPSMVFKRNMSSSCFFDTSDVARGTETEIWGDAVPWMKSMRWRFDDTPAEDELATRTGTSALFWAAMSNRRRVLCDVIEGIRTSGGERLLLELVNRPLTNPYPHFCLPAFSVPLHVAMALCSWDIVKVLLGAGANPLALCGPRRYVSPPQGAAMFGRSDNVTRWAAMFGDHSVNRRGRVVGMSTLHIGVRRDK